MQITDGTRIGRFAWIRRMPSGVYWGLFAPGFDLHSSYHESGERHFFGKVLGAKNQSGAYTWPGLSDFKGVTQLAAAGMQKELERYPQSSRKLRDVARVIEIDVRTIPKDFINFDIQLVEKGRLDLVFRWEGSQLTVIGETDPWIVVQFW